MSRTYEVVLPFWLDRPDNEALDVALAPRNAGLDSLWVGEMATYDAFALATAVGHRAPGLRLKLGRSRSLSAARSRWRWQLLGCPAHWQRCRLRARRLQSGDCLGLARPAWAQHASRMRETIECLRSILAGTRADYTGQHVRSHGFRLRKPMPDSRIAVGAFGPAMTRVAAQCADEVVLNLVPPARVAAMRRSSTPKLPQPAAPRRA